MRKLMHFLAPYKKRIILMFIFLFLQVMGTLYIPTLTASIVNDGIVTGSLDTVWRTGCIWRAIAFRQGDIIGT